MNSLHTPLFEERVYFLNASQFWTRSQHEEFQVKKLKHLVYYVKENIPFYREYLSKNNLSYNDFNNVEDIKKFPFIDKKLIQEDYDKFLPINGDKKKYSNRTTGGSTGTPLTVYSDLDFYSRDKANTQHYMNVFGLDIFHYRSIRIYGDKIEQSIIDNGEYWFLADNRKLIMSCYHINNENAKAYVEKINEFNPKYIHTRPSALFPLANYIINQNLELKIPIRFIFCDGEYITKGQRLIIERAFQGRLINVYGHTEGSAVGHPCLFSDSLHFMPQVGIVEILDKGGNKVTRPGDKGELVTTGFNNFIFPLIRYRTGDIVVMDVPGCACGRNYPIISAIEGRTQDYVLDIKNRLVPLAPAIFNYNDMDWKGIKEFKVIQHSAGILVLQIVLEQEKTDLSENLKRYIQKNISNILGNAFQIDVQFVNSLERTSIGKYRYLDQKMDLTWHFRDMKID